MRKLFSAVVLSSSLAFAQAQEDASPGPEGSATASPSPTNPTPNPATAPGTEKEAPNASHTVERGDTLWDLSRKFLGSPWYWPKVWSYNPDIANPHWIYPGNTVRFFGAEDQPSQVEVGGPEIPDVEEGQYDDDTEVIKAGQIGYRPKNATTLVVPAFVTARELELTAKITGSFSEAEMLSYPFTVYVDISGKKTLRQGETALIFREGGEVLHPVTQALVGYITRVVAEGKVLAVDGKRNIATVLITKSVDEVYRGDSISPAGESVVRTVAPRRNDKELKGGVVLRGAQRFVVLQAEGLQVFIDRGADDGVKLGNSFTFFRSGDTQGIDRFFNPQVSDDSMPREDVGSCMVVDVKAKVSCCLITRSLRELMPGDAAEMVPGLSRSASR